MPALRADTQFFDAALRLVSHVFHDRINAAARTSLANDILCVAAGLSSAVLIEQLYPNSNDIDRIQSLFHHGVRFNHLDLLCIGSDHVFIIHRELLLQDIHDYLSESENGLRRVFINVDYLLSQPEIIPGRRYEPLDKYLRKYLLPDIQSRVQSWNQAELCYLPLPAPDRVDDDDDDEVDTTMTFPDIATTTAGLPRYSETATEDPSAGGLSMATLSGWLLGFPVNYVLPTTAHMMARKALKKRERDQTRQQKLAAAKSLHQQQHHGGDQVLPTVKVNHDSTDCSTCIDDGNMSDDGGRFDKYGQGGQSSHPDQDDEVDDEDMEEDSSHNSLANRKLILTHINLSANEDIQNLTDHCLISFSYPASIIDGTTGAEMSSSGGGQLPTAPASPVWFPGGTDERTNPFETTLLLNSPPRSSRTAMPSALPPTPPTSLGSIVPSSCPIVTATKSSPTIAGPSAGVVPSAIFAPSSPSHKASPPHMQSRSRHPLDTTPDSSNSGDDPSSPSNSRHHRHKSSTTADARDHSRSRSRGRSQNRHRRSSSNMGPYHFQCSQEPNSRRSQEKKSEEEDHEPLPQGHPEICAAGRSMLLVLHSRFQRQAIWSTWQIGQQTVTLPVVAL
ncbi:hypothetical protein BGZ96_010101 [Linnemannia gamsii]|uniref:BTB domain-containing protein n=1 Tax=Linnemannia gamsii TaxID=64522 RepID=A0ABQ7JV64_9FUNG|nr:hypothetical protein BGZ96_010101 [Linnemannia gamsii]